MLWFTLWFLVILKIPAIYLAWVIWYAVKDPPDAAGGQHGADEGGGPGWRPSTDRRRERPRRGPHGSPVRRPLPRRVARVREN